MCSVYTRAQLSAFLLLQVPHREEARKSLQRISIISEVRVSVITKQPRSEHQASYTCAYYQNIPCARRHQRQTPVFEGAPLSRRYLHVSPIIIIIENGIILELWIKLALNDFLYGRGNDFLYGRGKVRKN